MTTIGMVGLGRMGSAMAERLHGQGFDVIGWDHDGAANARAKSVGMRIAANAREAAAAAAGGDAG